MSLVGGGLKRCRSQHRLIVLIGRRNGCLLIVEFSFIKDNVCEILMAFWCMFFTRVLIMGFGVFRCASLFMACSCIAPFTPVVMVMRASLMGPSTGLSNGTWRARRAHREPTATP